MLGNRKPLEMQMWYLVVAKARARALSSLVFSGWDELTRACYESLRLWSCLLLYKALTLFTSSWLCAPDLAVFDLESV